MSRETPRARATAARNCPPCERDACRGETVERALPGAVGLHLCVGCEDVHHKAPGRARGVDRLRERPESDAAVVELAHQKLAPEARHQSRARRAQLRSAYASALLAKHLQLGPRRKGSPDGLRRAVAPCAHLGELRDRQEQHRLLGRR